MDCNKCLIPATLSADKRTWHCKSCRRTWYASLTPPEPQIKQGELLPRKE